MLLLVGCSARVNTREAGNRDRGTGNFHLNAQPAPAIDKGMPFAPDQAPAYNHMIGIPMTDYQIHYQIGIEIGLTPEQIAQVPIDWR